MIANIYCREDFAHIGSYNPLYNPVRDNSVTSEQTVPQMITDSIKVTYYIPNTTRIQEIV